MQTVTHILIDHSGSMKSKIEVVKKLLLEEIIPELDYSYKIGITLFTTEHSAAPRKVILKPVLPFGLFNQDDLIKAIKLIGVPDGGTPIAQAIKYSFEALKIYSAFDKRIILITDGEETEGGDYEAEAKIAGEQGTHCQIHIIGLDLKPEQFKKAKVISTLTNGSISIIQSKPLFNYDQITIKKAIDPLIKAVSPKKTYSQVSNEASPVKKSVDNIVLVPTIQNEEQTLRTSGTGSILDKNLAVTKKEEESITEINRPLSSINNPSLVELGELNSDASENNDL